MRRVRYAQGRLDGVRYQFAGRVPAPDVPDDVLANRLRSDLGKLEKRLDIPRVQVAVDDHFVTLHGDVGSVADAEAVERWVRHGPGVRGVESYLHIGLSAGQSRPSTGRAQQAVAPSPALHRLLAAATRPGLAPGEANRALRAVLSTFAERLPAGERHHVFAHLPADVRELACAPRRHGRRPARVRTLAELVVVAVDAGLEAEHAEAIVESVLGCLRQLVPEEVIDVAAVLPDELRGFWLSAVPG